MVLSDRSLQASLRKVSLFCITIPPPLSADLIIMEVFLVRLLKDDFSCGARLLVMRGSGFANMFYVEVYHLIKAV